MDIDKHGMTRHDAHVLVNEAGAICPFCGVFNGIEEREESIVLNLKQSCKHANMVKNISKNAEPILTIWFHRRGV